MSAPRRTLAALVAAAGLALAPVAAHAQSTSNDTTTAPPATLDPTVPPITSSDDGSSSDPGRGSSSGSTKSKSKPSALPNTGIDARALAAFGVAFLLAGTGLRLRLRDGRR